MLMKKELIDDNRKLREENKKLKSLCDKYEEEHKTVFEEWKKTIAIIDELEKWSKEMSKGRPERTPYDEIWIKIKELKEGSKK